MSRPTVASVFVLLQLGLAIPAAAQFVPLQGREYREVFNPTNPVRGEAVIGVVVLGRDAADWSRLVDVWLPERFSGDLNVETATADGRFRGEGVYRGSSAGGEWVRITLNPASSGGAARSIPGDAETLALAVRGPGQTFYVARWATPAAAAAAQLRVYVNSRRADMFLRAGETVVRCSALNVTQPLRFDHYCDVPLAKLPASGQLILIRRDQSDEQTQTFTVHARDIH